MFLLTSDAGLLAIRTRAGMPATAHVDMDFGTDDDEGGAESLRTPPPVEETEHASEQDEEAEDADNEEEDSDDDEAHKPRKRSRGADSARVVGAGWKRKSKPHKDTKFPERAAQRRAQGVVTKILWELSQRPDIRADVLNRVILRLSKEEREELRSLGAIQQENYLAKRDCVDFLERECFNALHSIDLRACEALSIRLLRRISDRFACDSTGKRRVIARPPDFTGIANPVTRKSNREQGILWEHRAVLAPFCFRNSSQMKAAADAVLEGRTLHLSHDFDGAAWDLWEQARDLLEQLERDGNLVELPVGAIRNLQIIFDGHGWNSRTGAVRFVLRCTQTLRDHNATRNARTPIFALGSDKHAHLEKMMAIGGERSMHSLLYGGLKVTEHPAASMPQHVQDDELFLPLACIGCA